MSDSKRDNPLSLGSAAPSSNGPATASLSDRVRSLRLPAPEKSASSFMTILPWVICVALLVLVGYSVFMSQLTAASLDTLQTTVDQMRKTQKGGEVGFAGGGQGGADGPGVPADAVVLAVKGYILPLQQVQVSPKVGGMVLSCKFKENDRVAKDTILAQLETIDYQADYDRTLAIFESAWQRYKEAYLGWRPEEIAQVKAELDEAETQREQLYLAYRRSSGLKSGGALAMQEFEQAQSQYQAIDRRVEKLRLNLKLYQLGPRMERIDAAAAEWMQAYAEMRKSRWRLDNCTVRAPISGVILTKKAEEGSQVNPAAFSNGLSASLCDMADLTNMEVDLSINEKDIGRLLGFKYMKCQVRPDAFGNRTYSGYVSRIMPIADRSKGAVPVRVKIIIPLEEEGRYLRPEMSALVSFLNAEYENPPDAPAPEANGKKD